MFAIALVGGWATLFPAPAAWRKAAGLSLWSAALAVLARRHPEWLVPGIAGTALGVTLHWLVRRRIGGRMA